MILLHSLNPLWIKISSIRFKKRSDSFLKNIFSVVLNVFFMEKIHTPPSHPDPPALSIYFNYKKCTLRARIENKILGYCM